MNVKLEAALAYSRMHWRIFPCHSIMAGRCSCSRDPAVICTADPPSPGKHPRVKGGFKAATDDPEQIRRWWTKWPEANIALATGSGIVVFDIDGEEGFREFQQLVATHGAVPPTLASQTGRGAHLFFATQDGAPSVRSSAVGKVHVRGEGGYVILPPSNHLSGRDYRWIKKLPLAPLPDTLRQWSQGYDISNKTVARAGSDNLGQLPAYLQRSQRDVGQTLDQSLKTVWSPTEQARLISALAAIKPDAYETWVTCGMALHQLRWEGNGTDLGFGIWDAWSQGCPEKYNFAACESKWNSFGRSGRQGVTLGTLYHMASQAGWQGGAEPPKQPGLNGTANGVNGHHALPAAFLNPAQGAIHFPDLTEDGKPRSTCTNAGVAVKALGIICKKDLFHEKMLVAGEPINAWAGDMSDDVIQMIRKAIRAHYGFDPNDKNTRDACTQLCLENQFDPVCDYLASLQWDGKPRLDRWMADYLGAGDTELNRAIGRLSLIAAVRRARQPGTKFDQIVVLEGTEGRGKSTALEILAGRENFSDQKVLDLPDKEQQEAMCGIWIYEIAELTGMRRAATEHVKAFASRTVDRARPAYGRYRIDRPRRAICFATTNDDEYLKSETGNRRFWPVVTGHIDLDGLRADRDQLWAEAAMLEARGESIGLPEQLWKHASAEQHARLESDVWTEAIQNYLALGKDDVSVWEVLTENQFLRLEAARVGRSEQMRAAAILRRLHFEKYRRWTPGKAPEWRYRRPSA